MKTFVEYQTQRLSIQPLTLDDASHILALNLDPDWQQFIGDCGVDDLENAKGYIINGPLRMYRDNGFGVLAVRETVTGAFIGTCGLLQREKLANPDIGFAFLPVGRGKGYALEACLALLSDVKHSQQWQHVNALVTPTNHASIKLLGKLGFNYVKSLPDFDDEKDTHLYRLNF